MSPGSVPSKLPSSQTVDQQKLEAGWLARARKGDPDAFGEFFNVYHARLHAVVSRIVINADDARDIAQRSWVKAWQKLDSFKGDSSFYTWLCRIATFTALDHLRSRKRRGEVEYLDELGDASEGRNVSARAGDRPDRAMQKTEIRERFEAALVHLSDKHRTALILREVEGLSYADIARAMECRIGTVMSRIFNARKIIQQHLKDA
jgi:RNA polymerase sigma-70 factor, ECF subfamily